MKNLTALQAKAVTVIKENGKITGTDLDRHLFVPGRGNVYSVLKALIKKGFVQREGFFYRIAPPKRTLTEHDFELVKKVAMMDRTPKTKTKLERLKKVYEDAKELTRSYGESKQTPLISIIKNEIKYIESGIDSLMITKSYLERRIEQLEKGLA